MAKKTVDIKRKCMELTYELSGTIDEVVERLIELKATQKADEVLILEYETEYGCYGDSDRQVVNLYDRRAETDIEYETRLQKEEELDRLNLLRKRTQLEQLKKELGEG